MYMKLINLSNMLKRVTKSDRTFVFSEGQGFSRVLTNTVHVRVYVPTKNTRKRATLI